MSISRFLITVFAAVLSNAVWANFEPVRFELAIKEGLESPIDVALATDGSVLVLDAKSMSVVRYSAQGSAMSRFGSKALFQKPVALDVGPDGHIAVADQRAKAILIVDGQGNLLTRIGGGGNGSGQFSKLVDVAYDQFGFIYTSDAGSKRISRFTSQGVLLAEISFPNTVPDAISVDRSGRINLLVAGGAEVLRFRPNESLAGLERIKFNPKPSGAGGVFVDNYGDLFITRSSKNNVQKFDDRGSLRASFGSRGKSQGAFSTPTRMAGNDEGMVFVVDTRNRRVQGFSVDSSSSNPLEKLATSGPSVTLAGVEAVTGTVDDLGFSGLDTQFRLFSNSGRVVVKGLETSVMGRSGKKSGEFRSPKGVAALGDGRYVVADTGNHRVQIIEANGSATVIGERGKDPGFFNMPQSVAVNSDGMIYVSDTKNSRVQIFTEQGIYVHSFGVPGKKSKDANAALDAFVSPTSLVIDSANEVHVLDVGLGRVVSFDSRGTPLRSVEGLIGAVDIAVDSRRNLYVAANGCHCVRVYDVYREELLRFGGVGSGGGQLVSVSALAVAGHSVLVADSGGGSDLTSSLLGMAKGKKSKASGGIKTFDVLLDGVKVEDRASAEHSFYVDAATRNDPAMYARHHAAAVDALAQKLSKLTGKPYADIKRDMRIDSEIAGADGAVALRGSIEAIALPERDVSTPLPRDVEAPVDSDDEVELAF